MTRGVRWCGFAEQNFVVRLMLHGPPGASAPTMGTVRVRRCAALKASTFCKGRRGRRPLRMQVHTNAYERIPNTNTTATPNTDTDTAQIQIQTQKHPQIQKHIHPHSQPESGTGLLKTSEIVENRRLSVLADIGARILRLRFAALRMTGGWRRCAFAGDWCVVSFLPQGSSRTPTPTAVHSRRARCPHRAGFRQASGNGPPGASAPAEWTGALVRLRRGLAIMPRPDRGERIATPVCALARNDSPCMISLRGQEDCFAFSCLDAVFPQR